MKKLFIKTTVSLFLLFSVITAFAQGNPAGFEKPAGFDGPGGIVLINGSSNVNVNDVKTYTAIPAYGVTIYTGYWTAPGATILSQNATSVTIKWTTAGYKYVDYEAINTSIGYIEGFYNVTVNAASAPGTPTTPTLSSQNCTNATILRSTPPSGVTWYWQGTNSTGNSTSNSNASYSLTSSGTYYLRARNTSGVWSAGSSSIIISLGTTGGVTWYADTDGDQLGDPNSTIVQCVQPSGYVSNNSDQCPTTNGGGSSTGCPSGTNPFGNENYIYTISPQKETTSISTLTQDKDKIESITYFDGLGRVKQSIGIKQSPLKKDIVTHIEYDEFGRQAKEFLPYASNDGNGLLKSTAKTATNNYYVNNFASDIDAITPNPYSEKEYDNSPLNRVLKQAAPGKDWGLGAGHEIEFDYDTNTGTEVRKYYVTTSFVNPTYVATLQLNTSSSNNYGNYNANELYKTITRDENHIGTSKSHTTEEFKNKQGQVILKRTYIGTTAHDTYYVYDDFGNLTYVLPPKSEPQTAKPDAVELSELCYQYRYDKRNRLVQKKIPGKGWEYIIYDKLDRPVLTQDAVQRTPRKWLFTKYDVLGRVVYTGIYTHGSLYSQAQMQNYFDTVNNTPAEYYEEKQTSSGSLGIYYSNSDFPNASLEVLTVNYYDNYTFNRAGAGITANSFGINSTTRLKGLATGSRVKVLGEPNWITTVTYYDDKARPIYVYSKNDYLFTTDIVKSKLDFVGKVIETSSIHTKTDDNLPTITTTDKFEYDHVGRLKKQTQEGSNRTGVEVIAYNTYDELGQLKNKGVGGKTTQARLQDVDYRYNVRGWLTHINDVNTSNNSVSLNTKDLFGFEITYNKPGSGGTALFNGNISQTLWKTKSINLPPYNPVSNKYSYQYDDLNRITVATDNTGKYNLYGIVYDKNGNIRNLRRDGKNHPTNNSFGEMDRLTYNYANGNKSNKLLSVYDAMGIGTEGFKNGVNTTTEYTYDANGNMLRDYNKNMTSNILYNHLNLPTRVTIDGQHINYVYDATGAKQRKTVSEVTTDYAGNYIYKKTGSGVKRLEFFNHPEGYVKNDNGVFNYVYQYKDHLGNVRLSYTDINKDGDIDVTSNPNTNEIVEESNYYPFGLEHKGYNNIISSNGNSTAQEFKYNGVEYEESLGLNLYEMDLRQYDPAIGRWNSIDPVIHYEFSPFTAFDNNPIFWADPSGADSWQYTGNGMYTNRDTGEVSDDYQRAISETQSHFGETPPDNIYTNSKTGEVTIHRTNDSSDREYVDGKYVGTSKKGTKEAELIKNGTKYTSMDAPQAVGMGFTDGVLTVIASEMILVRAGVYALFGRLASSSGKLILNAKWAQKTFGGAFSAGGKFAGKTVDEVSALLRSGKMKPSDVTIDLVVRDGQALILNTRSSAALTRAGVPRSQWNVANRTGQEFFENQLTNQLTRNKLTSAGTSTIRQSGTTNVIGH